MGFTDAVVIDIDVFGAIICEGRGAGDACLIVIINSGGK